MSTEIAKTYDIQPGMSDDDFAELAVTTKFLPRIQLFGSSAVIVKRGKFPAGHYGLVTGKDMIIDLGESVDVLPLNLRAKALDTSGDKPESVFDKKSERFKEITAKSAQKDSGCMYGPEFLIWIPSEKKFCTFFMCNPTMRREAPMLREQLLQPTTLKVQFIESKQYGGWHGPVVVPCSTPFELPSAEDVNNQNTLFVSPPESMIEEVADDESSSDRER